MEARLAQFLIHKRKYGGRNADDYKRRDRPPNGIRLRELPNGQNTKNRANDEGDRNYNKRDPADELRVYDAFGFKLLLF